MPDRPRPNMAFGEILSFSYDTFCSNKVRFILTALGMVIGTASLILVVTIGMTGRQYALGQIQAIGTNEIWAEYEGAQHISNSSLDPMTVEDVQAVQEQVPGVIAASPVVTLGERIPIGNGDEKDVQILGVYPEYRLVRNLTIVSGRFFDREDSQAHNKVAVITEKMARSIYGSPQAAVGKIIKLTGLPFTVIGTFKERVESFGQSEVSKETVLIPITVLKYFTDIERIDPMYVQAKSANDVESVTRAVREILESRHRPGAKYTVENLTEILNTAESIGVILELVLILVSAIALIISGIGIMNIMLVTVTERTREIGLRMAVGASRREILAQFLAEAILISLAGGLAGIAFGTAIPYSVRFFEPALRIPVSQASIVVAFAVSCLVGVIFGMLPAVRASRLSPTEALRYE